MGGFRFILIVSALVSTVFGTASASASTAASFSLIDYLSEHTTHKTLAQLQSELPAYNRILHFGDWINDDPENDCLDVRNEVLLRDADKTKPITYFDAGKCRLNRAVWVDPYSGDTYKTARSLHVDHMVPLKHAYLTGAQKWSPSKRCHYANYLANKYHLRAVSGHENMSKNDDGPEGYIPPDKTFQCQYIAEWMKIKAIWQLIATEEELEAVEAVAAERGCSAKSLSMTDAELESQRSKIRSEMPAKCLDFEDIVQMDPTAAVGF